LKTSIGGVWWKEVDVLSCHTWFASTTAQHRLY
jgi:hypothetical protein